jgi:hypothetical protein
MSALVVVETYFGNTHHVAEVVADTFRSHGMPTDVAEVEGAPTQLSDEIDLLVVGAPTHDLGMSTAESRQAACARTGHAVPATGVREWLARLSKSATPPLVAVFDTRTGYPWLAGSAAAQASAVLSERGFPVMAARESFRVDGVAGPLRRGEDDRARRWANVVVARLVQRRGIRYAPSSG